MKLTAKYRPRTLSALAGQSYARLRLSDYMGNPYPSAFLFSGPKGVGKSSAALALAHDLGAADVASLHVIDSARADVESLEWVQNQFRFCPLGSWRVVVFEEADTMTPRAGQLMLSLLENLPSRTTVIATTNPCSTRNPLDAPRLKTSRAVWPRSDNLTAPSLAVRSFERAAIPRA